MQKPVILDNYLLLLAFLMDLMLEDIRRFLKKMNMAGTFSHPKIQETLPA